MSAIPFIRRPAGTKAPAPKKTAAKAAAPAPAVKFRGRPVAPAPTIRARDRAAGMFVGALLSCAAGHGYGEEC